MKLTVAQGIEGPLVYLNGHRIAGKKPYGLSTNSKEFYVTDMDVYEALRWTSADVIALRSIISSLEHKNYALSEAVRWERECEDHVIYMTAIRHMTFKHWRAAYPELLRLRSCARAEVDRLITDCKGEG